MSNLKYPNYLKDVLGLLLGFNIINVINCTDPWDRNVLTRLPWEGRNLLVGWSWAVGRVSTSLLGMHTHFC